MITHLGNWTIERLDLIMREAAAVSDIGERIDFISKKFLDTPYQESTLIGDINTPEVFVINLEGMDCMTFIEYVEAMRLSGSFTEFTENLKRVRYRNREVKFECRRHFFTDWVADETQTVNDVTAIIGGVQTVRIHKMLNLKNDGANILHGINPVDREINYIPSDSVDDSVIDNLRTGDYAGIYSDKDGLDVTHVGIIIKDENKVCLRHASSGKETKKVIDDDFKEYVARKEGIVIFRPRQTGLQGGGL